MQADVKTRQIENINGGTLNYVIVETERGKVHISVGEKNYAKINELLKDTYKTQTGTQPNPDTNKK